MFKMKGKLNLRALLTALVASDWIAQSQAVHAMGQSHGATFQKLHPLAQVARLNIELKKQPGKYLTAALLAQWLAEQVDIPFFHIDPLKIDAAAMTQVMSYEFAMRHGLLAVDQTSSEVVIATTEPFVTGWEVTVEQVTQKTVRKVIAPADDIERFRVEFYRLAKSVLGATRHDAQVGRVGNLEQLLQIGSLHSPDANDEGIVNIVDWLLQYAFDQRASDIHIEPRREQVFVRFRIDGILHSVYDIPFQVGLAVISRIKILGRMNVAEKRRPQDGRLKTKSPDGNEIELRLSTLPTAFGEKMVLRIFDPEVLLKPFEALGLVDDVLDQWNTLTAGRHGIVLVTGPTGSGKTTTLYSTLKQLARPEVNVCTIEDPIEMIEPAFNQMQVQSNLDLNFSDGVRALLRQDPDIIMVGETRDLETASMAVQAALTGHLVLTTLHTNDAPSAITRLLDLGVPAYLIRSCLLGVMAQRLVRTLCPHCKASIETHVNDWSAMTKPSDMAMPDKVFQAVGCLECRNTGYLGRMGLYEIFSLSDGLEQEVVEQIDIKRLRQRAIQQGMKTLRLSGAHQVALGMTSIDEVMRVTPDHDH